MSTSYFYVYVIDCGDYKDRKERDLLFDDQYDNVIFQGVNPPTIKWYKIEDTVNSENLLLRDVIKDLLDITEMDIAINFKIQNEKPSDVTEFLGLKEMKDYLCDACDLD